MHRISVLFTTLALALAIGLSAPALVVAQDATPADPQTTTTNQFPFTADPSFCTGEQADQEFLLDLWFGTDGTPTAADEGSTPGATPDTGISAMEITIPVGPAADEATVAQVTETVRAVFSCFAAGDLLRSYGLFSENLSRLFGPEEGETRLDAIAFLTGSPVPADLDEPGTIVVISDVMELSDGRIGAIVVDESDGEFQAAYAIFVREGDRLLVDEVINFALFEDE